jgi:hypothetical protein
MKSDGTNNGTNLDAESFLARMENEIALKKRIPILNTQKPLQQQALDVVGQFDVRTNIKIDGIYQSSILVRFRPFLKNIEVVPSEMRALVFDPQTGKHEIGYWLRLAD